MTQSTILNVFGGLSYVSQYVYDSPVEYVIDQNTITDMVRITSIHGSFFEFETLNSPTQTKVTFTSNTISNLGFSNLQTSASTALGGVLKSNMINELNISGNSLTNMDIFG